MKHFIGNAADDCISKRSMRKSRIALPEIPTDNSDMAMMHPEMTMMLKKTSTAMMNRVITLWMLNN